MHAPLTLPRDRTAALFIDLQEEHRRDPRYLVEGYDRILARVQALQHAARAAALPLFHCQYIVDGAALRPFHPVMADGTSAFSDRGDPHTALCPEVAPQPGERLLIKAEASAFGTGELAPLLRAGAIEWLLVAGVWTEACVDATVKDAVAQGYRVLLVKDACGSATAAMHQAGILNLANRLYGGAVTDAAGACRLLAGERLPVWRVEGSVPLRFTFETAAALFESL